MNEITLDSPIKIDEAVHNNNVRGYKLNDETIDKIVMLYNSGYRKGHICKELNLSYTSINKAIALRS